jgi:hypothetical protein
MNLFFVLLSDEFSRHLLFKAELALIIQSECEYVDSWLVCKYDSMS